MVCAPDGAGGYRPLITLAMKIDRAPIIAEPPARHRAVRPRRPEPPGPVAAYRLVALLFGPGMLLWAAGLTAFACGLGS
jgi:hypothetical protein